MINHKFRNVWIRNSCIVHMLKTKDYAQSWTFQQQIGIFVAPLMFPGFIPISLYKLWWKIGSSM